MKGILDYSIREGWLVRTKIAPTNINDVIENKSFKVWSNKSIDYTSALIDKEVDIRLALINPLGREMDPHDLTKNLSSCEWFAIIENEETLINKIPSEDEIENICEKLWGEYEETLQASQYMARLTFKQRKEDFKSGIKYFIKSK